MPNIITAMIASDPLTSAGSRFRIANWAEKLNVRTIRRPKKTEDLKNILMSLSEKKRLANNLSSGARSLFGFTGWRKSDLPILIIQKTPPLALAKIIEENSKSFHIIFDLCDPPINSYIITEKNQNALESFRILTRISKIITVSSQALGKSVGAESNTKYIRDCIDEPISYQREDGLDKEKLTLLWFGGGGSAHYSTGIYELEGCLQDLVPITKLYKLNLHICSNLNKGQFKSICDKANNIGVECCLYSEWSKMELSRQLRKAHYAWLPKCNNMATYYKSLNRMATAAIHGVRTITNSLLDPEMCSFKPIVINNIRNQSEQEPIPDLLDPENIYGCSMPYEWSPKAILNEWRDMLEAINQ
jgi:hypothetical protein